MAPLPHGTELKHAQRASLFESRVGSNPGRGIHFHAPDGDTLADIFQEIAHLPAAAIIE